jgi:hypothetical protein
VKDEGGRMRDESQTYDGVSQPPPTLEYAPADVHGKPFIRWWPLVTAVLLVVGSSCTTCACGCFDWTSFPFTLSAFGLACYGRVCNRNTELAGRVLLIFVVLLTALLFVKNVADILWLGHHAILG